MKAAFLVAPCRIELRDVCPPSVPDDGVLVDVKACGVCGSDLRRWREGPAEDSRGVVLGHEIGGVIAAVGVHATGYRVGQRMAIGPDVHCGRCYYCRRDLYNLCDHLQFLGISPGYPGGFCEQMAVSGHVLANGIVHPLPDAMSFVQGALAEPCSSVLAAHDMAGTGMRDTVLVMGGGPIGCLHVVVASARGARAILSEPNEGRRELARRFSPEAILDPSADDVPARVSDLTEGRGADIVVCANSVAVTQTQAVGLVRKGGRVILFGGLPKATPMVSLDANRIHYGEIQVVGAFSYHPTAHALALDLLRRGIVTTDLVTHTFTLDEVADAFAVADGGQALKVMVAL